MWIVDIQGWLNILVRSFCMSFSLFSIRLCTNTSTHGRTKSSIEVASRLMRFIENHNANCLHCTMYDTIHTFSHLLLVNYIRSISFIIKPYSTTQKGKCEASLLWSSSHSFRLVRPSFFVSFLVAQWVCFYCYHYAYALQFSSLVLVVIIDLSPHFSRPIVVPVAWTKSFDHFLKLSILKTEIFPPSVTAVNWSTGLLGYSFISRSIL